MKKTIFVLILGLMTSITASAADSKSEKHQEVTCSAEAKDCNHNDDKSKKSYNKDWTAKRLHQVEEVLPQPVADKSKATIPDKVNLLSPKFLSVISGTTVKLEWSKVENAKNYHLQISKDAGFNNRSMYIVDEKMLTETSFEVKNLEPGIKYFWRVAASNGDLKAGSTKSIFNSSSFSTK